MSKLTLGVHHVGLAVRDLERSKGFYTEVLGFELLREKPGTAYVSDGTTMITLWQQAEEAAALRVAGLHHLAFRVPGLESLVELEKRLRASGAKVQYDGYGEYGALTGLFFFDPDGIRIEAAFESNGENAGLPTIGGCGGHS